jgi:hypothetical protein
MFSFDKHAIDQKVGPAGTRYSLSPLMSEQNKVQRFAEDRDHQVVVLQHETASKLVRARAAKMAGEPNGLGIVRRAAVRQ